MRDVVEPTVDEYGYELHPAWGMISVFRSQVMGGPSDGAVLFDSDIPHHHVVTVRLHEARRKRELNRDHKMEGRVISEVTFTEAQWASFIASTNSSGVPCTIDWREATGGPVPRMPYAPRLQQSMEEVRGAAEHSMEMIRAAFEKVQEKPNKGNIRHLEAMIDNAPANMEFAAKSLSEHAENVVQRARADIEAFVVDKANQLGLDPGELAGGLPELTGGDTSRDDD